MFISSEDQNYQPASLPAEQTSEEQGDDNACFSAGLDPQWWTENINFEECEADGAQETHLLGQPSLYSPDMSVQLRTSMTENTVCDMIDDFLLANAEKDQVREPQLSPSGEVNQWSNDGTYLQHIDSVTESSLYSTQSHVSGVDEDSSTETYSGSSTGTNISITSYTPSHADGVQERVSSAKMGSKIRISKAEGGYHCQHCNHFSLSKLRHRHCKSRLSDETRQENTCPICMKSFKLPKDMKRHQKSSCNPEARRYFKCKCGKIYPRYDSLLRHLRTSNRNSDQNTHRTVQDA